MRGRGPRRQPPRHARRLPAGDRARRWPPPPPSTRTSSGCSWRPALVFGVGYGANRIARYSAAALYPGGAARHGHRLDRVGGHDRRGGRAVADRAGQPGRASAPGSTADRALRLPRPACCCCRAAVTWAMPIVGDHAAPAAAGRRRGVARLGAGAARQRRRLAGPDGHAVRAGGDGAGDDDDAAAHAPPRRHAAGDRARHLGAHVRHVRGGAADRPAGRSARPARGDRHRHRAARRGLRHRRDACRRTRPRC